MNTGEKKLPEENKEQPKKNKVSIPTQKTFSFYSAFNSTEDIDKKINKWLMEQAFKKQICYLGKVTSHSGFFGKKLVYVFMYSIIVEV